MRFQLLEKWRRPKGGVSVTSSRVTEKRPAVGEVGWGGAKVFSGIVLDEYNPDLKGNLALQIAEKMRRTSGQVRALGAEDLSGPPRGPVAPALAGSPASEPPRGGRRRPRR
jgi:hypothetical protein